MRQPIINILLICSLLFVVIAASKAQERCDYLIVSAPELQGSCSALQAHRESQGLRVKEISFADILASYPNDLPAIALQKYLKTMLEQIGLRFVLLVGDAGFQLENQLPFNYYQANYQTTKFLNSPDMATDWDYSLPQDTLPQLHIGRLPAQTPEQAESYCNRVIAYESELATGAWQRKLAMVLGEVGFSPMIDDFIVQLFQSVALASIPQTYEIETAWARSASKYCPYPPKFIDNSKQMLSDGALLYLYVGHGVQQGFDEVKYQNQAYPMLENAYLDDLSPSAGPPLMLSLACWNASIDGLEADAFGEKILLNPGGPIAFIGSTRISQPYGSALLGDALIQTLLQKPEATLGEAFDAARSLVLSAEGTAVRGKIDSFVALIQGHPALEQIRQDTVRHYILLGDPALRLRSPLPLEINASITDRRIQVAATLPISPGSALITIEKLPAPKAKLPEPEDEAGFISRYEAANNLVLLQQELTIENSEIKAEFDLPKGVKLPVMVKIIAWDKQNCAAGATQLVKTTNK